MKIIVERTKFEPAYREGLPFSWDVAFDIETETGMKLYAPTTIYYKDVPQPVTECSVTLRAFMETLPSQIQHLYKDTDVLTELDKLAAEVHQSKVALDEEAKFQQALDAELQQTKQRMLKQLEENRQERERMVSERIEQRKKETDDLDKKTLKFAGGTSK